MAITPTPAREYGFAFDGVNSKTKGVYITDGAFYSAPERDVELIEIPGRNGAFALDHGRFKNIQVTYHAVLNAATESDFIAGISDVRAWLCSKTGYVRVTDDFNPSEYRMAVCGTGITVSNLNPRTGEFDINFDCMPQRFLLTGETPQTISSGDTIENPTLFNARPVLEVNGYGAITINGDTISINNGALGSVLILQQYMSTRAQTAVLSTWIVTPDCSKLNAGDEVIFQGMDTLTANLPGQFVSCSPLTQTGTMFSYAGGAKDSFWYALRMGYSFNLGTVIHEEATADVTYKSEGGVNKTGKIRAIVDIDESGTMTFKMESYTDTPLDPSTLIACDSFTLILRDIYGVSTQSALGNPLYIDLDIGEAYKIEDGARIGVNWGVSFGWDLPELLPGNNVITYENTVTQLRIKPRWWTI